MVEPFQNNVSYSHFITLYRINQSPRIRKVIFPKVCYAIFLDILFWPKTFWNFYPASWIYFEIINRSVNKFVELFVFKFTLFKGFPFLLHFWINESYGYLFVHRTIKSSLISLFILSGLNVQITQPSLSIIIFPDCSR